MLVIRPKLGVELNFEKLIKFLIMNYQIDWIFLTYNLRSNPILVFEMFERAPCVVPQSVEHGDQPKSSLFQLCKALV